MPDMSSSSHDNLVLATRRLREAIDDALLTEDPVSVMWVRLHPVSGIQKELGADVADAALAYLQEALADALPHAQIHPLMDDEVLVIVPGADRSQAEICQEQAEDFLTQHPLVLTNVDGKGDCLEVRLRIDSGLALYPDDGDDAETVVQRAFRESQRERS